MPLHFLAALQSLQSQIVSRREETAWSLATVRSRIVTSEGVEHMIPGVQDAKRSWLSLPLEFGILCCCPGGGQNQCCASQSWDTVVLLCSTSVCSQEWD